MSDFSKYIHKVDRDNNMDLVRYILAFGVLIGHFNVIMGTEIPWVVSYTNRVGIFFAMSGFLLVGMLLKGMRYQDFLYKRFLRLTPSYVSVILLCGFSFVVISSLSPVEYFSSTQFYKYLLANLAYMNFVQPDLPGVLVGADMTAVNGSLWTMKVEWQIILLFPLMVMFAKKYRINIVGVCILSIISAIGLKIFFLELYSVTNQIIYERLSRQVCVQIGFFCFGAILYCYYPHFKRNIFRYLIPASICYFVLECGYFENEMLSCILHPVAMVLMFIMIGLIPKNIMKYIDRGHNISYEIFLTHFPIIQIVKHLGVYERYGTCVTFIISISATILVSLIIYFSAGRTYIKRQSLNSSVIVNQQPTA